MIAAVRGWGVSGHECVRTCREEARAFQRRRETWEIGEEAGRGRSCHHGEVFIELGLLLCGAVASFYFLGWDELSGL